MEKKKLASLFSLYFFVWGMNHHILRSAPDNSCLPFYLYILELRVSPCPEIVFHSIIAKSFIPKGIRSQWESEREREREIRDRTKFSFTWSACRCWRYMVGLFVEWMKEWSHQTCNRFKCCLSKIQSCFLCGIQFKWIP